MRAWLASLGYPAGLPGRQAPARACAACKIRCRARQSRSCLATVTGQRARDGSRLACCFVRPARLAGSGPGLAAAAGGASLLGCPAAHCFRPAGRTLGGLHRALACLRRSTCNRAARCCEALMTSGCTIIPIKSIGKLIFSEGGAGISLQRATGRDVGRAGLGGTWAGRDVGRAYEVDRAGAGNSPSRLSVALLRRAW